MGRPPASIEDRFWHRIMPEPNSGCWLWDGAVNSEGYGNMRCKGKTRPAHRISYEIAFGPIPKELQIDHLCRIRCCVNPDHMELVTNRQNVLRGTGPTAMNARKTHCPKGHKYSGVNLIVFVNRYGEQRACRACRKASSLAASRKRRALHNEAAERIKSK